MARGINYLAAVPAYAAELQGWQLHMLSSLHQVLHLIDGYGFSEAERTDAKVKVTGRNIWRPACTLQWPSHRHCDAATADQDFDTTAQVAKSPGLR